MVNASPSILFLRAGDQTIAGSHEPPPFAHDLNLDQVIDAVTAGWKDYDLTPFYYVALTDLDAILYRQEVMQDLARDTLTQAIDSFAKGMHGMRDRLALARRAEYPYERERWFLGAADVYCGAITQLAQALDLLAPPSRGMRSFRAYLSSYVGSAPFRALLADTRALRHDLDAIRYELLIKDNSITVLPYDGEADYTAVVEATFEKFRRGAVKDYRTHIVDDGRLNHIEAQVLERVALLNSGVFAALDAFCTQHARFADDCIVRFDREVHFYIAYLKFIGRLQRTGLSFCYPRLSNTSKEISCRDTFDLALAAKLAAQHGAVVTNDLALRGSERIFVVSGPNQGGKTTFARTFGQLHFLACLGCPVPGSDAQLFIYDHLFVHFERSEDLASQRGKLQDDLVRIHHILERATASSVVILNEVFSSTTLQDAIDPSRKVMAELVRLDLLAVCVTFLDDLASFDHKMVSVVSSVDPRNPTVRTFKLERRLADGLAFALAIAEKHRVTYDWLARRIGR